MCVCNYFETVCVLKRNFSKYSDLLNYNRSENLAPFCLTFSTLILFKSNYLCKSIYSLLVYDIKLT